MYSDSIPSTRSLIRSSDVRVHGFHSPTHSISPLCVRWLTGVRGDHVIGIICIDAFTDCVCCTYMMHLDGCICLTCIQDLWYSRSDDLTILIGDPGEYSSLQPFLLCIFQLLSRRLYSIVITICYSLLYMSTRYLLSCWTHPPMDTIFFRYQVAYGVAWSILSAGPHATSEDLSSLLFICILVYEFVYLALCSGFVSGVLFCCVV